MALLDTIGLYSTACHFLARECLVDLLLTQLSGLNGISLLSTAWVDWIVNFLVINWIASAFRNIGVWDVLVLLLRIV